MWLANPPKIVKEVYPSMYWKIPTHKKEIFITFDDGPTPGITEKVLDLLQKYQAHATFFCLGKNVAKAPDLFNRIKEEGHAIGNHTYNHINGWKVRSEEYFREIKLTEEIFGTQLFRPPYGRMRPKQIKAISKDYHIIMWSHLSLDYDKNYSKEECLALSTKDLESGSILVFHDSEKAKDRMFYALEGLLLYCQEEGWQCSAIKL